MHVTLIHNPDAGGARKPSAEHLMDLIRRAGHQPTYQSSKREDWHAVLDKPADLVAVAGGDGAVANVAKRLVHRGIPIAVLPLGTANNIARMLELTGSIEELVAGWATGRRLACDMGLAAGPWGSASFIESLGIGLLADIIRAADSRTGPGGAHPEAEIAEVLEISAQRLRAYPPRRLNIMLDGQDLSGDYLLVEAMNIRSVGANLDLAPDAEIGDGLLDVVLARESDRPQLAAYLEGRLNNQQQPPRLPVHKGRHLRVEDPGPDVHIDDEVQPAGDTAIRSSTSTIEVHVDEGALQFLV